MEPVPGILLLYHHPLTRDAATISEHVTAFEQFSRFPVFRVNVAVPPHADALQVPFRVVLLHYSLFGSDRYPLPEGWRHYLEASQAWKIAFFQDEYLLCRQRFDFINRYGVNSIYTLFEPSQYPKVYQRFTGVPYLYTQIPGYVSPRMLDGAARFARPAQARTIDLGYRSRVLPVYMGRGAQEKTNIALDWKRCAAGSGLRMDIETEEVHRLYGAAWYRFLGNCHAFLGVESGVSAVDLDDVLFRAYQERCHDPALVRYDDFWQALLAPYEDNVYYRTISPRHFEAAAFRTCQVMFEGRYSGILTAGEHYIALQKDFGNFPDALRQLRDPQVRRRITETCHRDLIESGRFTYARMLAEFDEQLSQHLALPALSPAERQRVMQQLHRGYRVRWAWAYVHTPRNLKARLYHARFPGRRVVAGLARPALKAYRWVKRRRAASGRPAGH